MRAAHHHSRVDIFGTGESRLQHPNGGQQVRDQESVHDEARPVGRRDDFLSQLVGGVGAHPVGGVVARQERRNQLHQFEYGHRVKEVHAHHLFGSFGGHRQLDDRYRGGIRRQDRLGIGDGRVEFSKDLEFHLFVLGDGFDDDLAIRQVGEVGCVTQVRANLRAAFGGDFARGFGAREGLFDALAPYLQRVVVVLHHDHVTAGARGDFGDTRAHQTATDDTNSFHLISSRAPGRPRGTILETRPKGSPSPPRARATSLPSLRLMRRRREEHCGHRQRDRGNSAI